MAFHPCVRTVASSIEVLFRLECRLMLVGLPTLPTLPVGLPGKGTVLPCRDALLPTDGKSGGGGGGGGNRGTPPGARGLSGGK